LISSIFLFVGSKHRASLIKYDDSRKHLAITFYPVLGTLASAKLVGRRCLGRRRVLTTSFFHWHAH
jgi:hypothetical protein